ncbi:MFS transporter [Longispora albida]|uniref:MFS transporter n=1 Tax=Longispora albida TaxID=203523 RepID=UPI000375CD1E|nr:MFS transporter [Longispora albida]
MRIKEAAGRGTLTATVLASGMALLDSTVVNVALPHLGRDLGAGLDGLQWTVNGYTLTLAAFVLLGGALGDRYGRRLIFLVGVVWFTVASVMCGFAGSVGLLVAARILQGIGAALLTPGSLALIQSSFAPEDRGRAIGLWAGLGGVAAAVGPFVGGWLVDALSWRWVFFLNIPLAVVVLVCIFLYVPESRTPGKAARFDVPGAAIGAISLGAITYALIDGSWLAGLAGVLAGIGFVLIERRSTAPMLPPGLFACRDFAVINVVTFFVYAALSGALFFLILYLQISAGYSAIGAGLTLLPFTLILLVFSPRAGVLGQKIGARLPLILGPLLSALGLLMLLGAGPSYVLEVLPGVLVLGAGMTLLVVPLTSSVLAAAPQEFIGVASGVNNAVARAAGLIAVAALPLLAGLGKDSYTDAAAFADGYRSAIWYCVALMVLGAAVTAGLLPARPAATSPDQTPNP